MPSKNPPTTFRFDPTSKAALQLIADRDGRSMANMLEWLIRKHCVAEGIGWPPPAVGHTKRGVGSRGAVGAAGEVDRNLVDGGKRRRSAKQPTFLEVARTAAPTGGKKK